MDERAARAEQVETLRRTVGFDAYAWVLTDPLTAVGSSPLADAPCLPELPRLIRLKYLTPVNRWTGLDPPVATLRSATGDDRAKSLVWRELQSSYDVGDVASLVFRDRHGTWGFLDLWRSGTDARFSATEVAHLAGLVAPVTAALREAVGRTFDDVAPAPARGGPSVLVLSPDLEVRAQTAESEAVLRTLLPPCADRRPVPAAAYNVAAQLLAVESGVDQHQAAARVHLGGGTWLTLRAARADPADREPEASARDIAVSIEPSSPAERADLYARAHTLSPRETDLLLLLLEGADTRTVAARLFLSEHTVQDHLKSVFAKTGVHTRRALLARVTGR